MHPGPVVLGGSATVMCYKCGEKVHYANKCPMKRKRSRSRDARLYCLECGEDGHLASWCEKDDDNQMHGQSPSSPALGQTSSVGLLARVDDQGTSARQGCH